MKIKQKSLLEREIKDRDQKIRGVKEYEFIHLVLKVPPGSISDVARMVNYLGRKFEKIILRVDISAEEGSLKPEEYKEKIEEAINQSRIEIEKEEIS
ncbi:MAG: hypothetical protein QW704_03035 [Candidatus Hadarchaeales archaeon]